MRVVIIIMSIITIIIMIIIIIGPVIIMIIVSLRRTFRLEGDVLSQNGQNYGRPIRKTVWCDVPRRVS